MHLTSAPRQTIDRIVGAAGLDQRIVMRSEAEAALTQIKMRKSQRILFQEEQAVAQSAIELLVRMDAIERGKGWWFRFKRRLQLTERYLGASVPQQSTAIENEVHNDAIQLMKLTHFALTKYLAMPAERLRSALLEDFAEDSYSFDFDAVTFVFPNLSDFYFTLSENTGSKSLCVTGRRRYVGFTLFAPDRGHWHCYAQDGMARAATSPRALAQRIEKKFGIRDMSSVLGL